MASGIPSYLSPLARIVKIERTAGEVQYGKNIELSSILSTYFPLFQLFAEPPHTEAEQCSTQ